MDNTLDTSSSNKTSPVTYRLTDDTNSRFKKIAEILDVTQEETLSTLLSVYELDVTKNTMKDRAKEIEEFNNHIKRLFDIYKNSLEINKNCEDTIRVELSKQLEKKDNLITNLQGQISNNKINLESLNTDLLMALKENEAYKEEVMNLKSLLKSNEDLMAEYKEKVETFSSMLNEYGRYRDQHNKSESIINSLKEEIQGLNLKIKESELEKNNLQDKIELINQVSSEYKETIKQLEQKQNTEIRVIKEEHKTEIQILEEKHSTELSNISEQVESKIRVEINKELLERDKQLFEKVKLINDLREQIKRLKKK